MLTFTFAGAALSALALVAQAEAADAPGKQLVPPPSALTQEQLTALAKSAKPSLPMLKSLPAEAKAAITAIGKVDKAPQGTPATGANTKPFKGPSLAMPSAKEGIPPPNYGAGELNTIYHYSDYLEWLNSAVYQYPERATGWFYFTAADNGTYRCTASLISRSILITAGHCVNQGGNGSAGWIKSGWFAPAFYNYNYPYGYAYAAWVNTTGGWYGSGQLDQGYDVGIVVLQNRAGTSTEIGNYTGWYGTCTGSCLQYLWQLSQLGYPANYYSGVYLTHGEHLEHSDGRDYIYGSGMQGGSSGGPHVANLNSLSDTASNLGQWPYRNYIFGVTSWGYNDQSLKIQGASSLTGPSNSNNFPGLYSGACNVARSLHGSGSC